MQNNSKINWKYFPITVIAPDGVELHGELEYWAKDYSVSMKKPFQVNRCGGHLPYGFAVVYITDEPRRNNIHQIDLIERGKEILLSIYKEQAQ